MNHKKSNTFLEYLQTDKYYDKIFNRVFAFCCRNKDSLVENKIKADIRGVRSFEENSVELDFKSVCIDSKDDSIIDFDIAIDVTLEA